MANQLKRELPRYRAFMYPTLVALNLLGGSARVRDMNAKIAELMNLSEVVLALTFSDVGGDSKHLVISYRCGLARKKLKRMRLIESDKNGAWRLNEAGYRALTASRLHWRAGALRRQGEDSGAVEALLTGCLTILLLAIVGVVAAALIF